MTFDALNDERDRASTWVEDGITATGAGGYISPFRDPGAVHFDGWGTPFASRIDFSTGSLFVPESVTIKPSGSDFCAAPCSPLNFDDPFPYISIMGYRDNVLVEGLEIYRPASSVFEIISLSFFGTIDLLTIGVNGSRDGVPGIIDGRCGSDHGCGHFNLGSVQVTSVPEPETLLLLLPGLVTLLLRRRCATHTGR